MYAHIIIYCRRGYPTAALVIRSIRFAGRGLVNYNNSNNNKDDSSRIKVVGFRHGVCRVHINHRLMRPATGRAGSRRPRARARSHPAPFYRHRRGIFDGSARRRRRRRVWVRFAIITPYIMRLSTAPGTALLIRGQPIVGIMFD